jgi:predicted amidophosphoribosyltransferase
VAIIDDVLTTGSTVRQLDRVLRANGAETVEVWAVARTPPRDGERD